MKKKIGILTYHSSDNFGSVLQAYALSKFINFHNVDCEIIDYRKIEVQRLYRVMQPMNNRYNFLTNIYKIPFYSKLKCRRRSFEYFRQKYLPLSTKYYNEKKELTTTEYDCYVVGSDQVWNTSIVDFDESFLLKFANGSRIAYAASCGSLNNSAAGIMDFRAELKEFSAISLRESSTVAYFHSRGFSDVQLVCDPVFLLNKEEWELMIDNNNISNNYGNYVLCYFAGGVSNEMETFSRELAANMGIERIILMPEWKNILRSGKKVYDCGPIEFVQLIRDARVVCTNSFHGTAFSIIFDKEFYVEAVGSDARIMDLLMRTGKMQSSINLVVGNELIDDGRNLIQLVADSKSYLQKHVIGGKN